VVGVDGAVCIVDGAGLQPTPAPDPVAGLDAFALEEILDVDDWC
jgi:hypothetical protein